MHTTSDDDEAWFTALVYEHRQELRNYVSRRVDRSAVDDVVSEVLGAAWRHRELRPPEPRLWLLRTAQNAMLHQFRGQRRRERLSAKLAGEPVEATVHTGEPSEASEVVRRCLQQLSDTDQELLRLSYWEQLAIDEIAYVVGGSPGAVRVRLHRARRRLAARLPAWLGPPPVPVELITHTPTTNGGRR